jgi:RNA-binding protein 5/10
MMFLGYKSDLTYLVPCFSRNNLQLLATCVRFLIQKNLANDALRQTAKEKVTKLQNPSASTSATANTKQVYRDRASERRVIHGQPDIPLPEASGASSSTGGKKIRDVAIVAPDPPAPPPKEPAKDENNIGNKLLKKMGWSEGTGLGLSGEGRVDPMFVFLFFSFNAYSAALLTG